MSQERFWETPGLPIVSETATEDLPSDLVAIGEPRFIGREVPTAIVSFTIDGETVGPISIPVDPDNMPSDLELGQRAGYLYDQVEYIRRQVTNEEIQQLTTSIRKSGLVDEIVDTVAGSMVGAFTVQVNADADDAEDVEDLELIGVEIERFVQENRETIVRKLADEPANGLGSFWEQFARDILAHAWLWASEDLRDESPDYLSSATDDEYSGFLNSRFQDDGSAYITRAMLTLAGPWTEMLGGLVISIFEEPSDDPEAQRVPKWLIDVGRKRLEERRVAEHAGDAEAAKRLLPAFDDATGYGRIGTDLISFSSRLALVAPWGSQKSSWPEYHHENGAGHAMFSPDPGTFTLISEAWHLVDRLGDEYADTLDYICARARSNRGPRFTSFKLSPEEILDARGISKHKRGGHKPENIAAVITQIQDLGHILVRARVSGYVKDKRGRIEAREVDSPLIDIDRTEWRVTLFGERTLDHWILSPGDWVKQIDGFTPQIASMTMAILRLHAQKESYAKRIGRYLTYQYRVRRKEKSWSQPYTIKRILDEAGIVPPEAGSSG